MRILLVASGGGHLRQMLQMSRFIVGHETVLAVNETGMSRDLNAGMPVRFVTDFAFGMRKSGIGLGEYLSRLLRCWRDCWAAVREARPDVIISTGASLAVFCFLAGKLRGAKCIFIESVARINAPSLTGRLVGGFVDLMIVQWPQLQIKFPRAMLRRGYQVYPGREADARSLIFATTGASQMPFDRLVRAVDDLASSRMHPFEYFIQTGASKVVPRHAASAPTLTHEEMKEKLEQSELVISHAGSGSIFGALEAGCRVVVMPRTAAEGEHYDDHQLEIAEAFEAQGWLHVAMNPEELSEAVQSAMKASPTRVVYEGQSAIEAALSFAEEATAAARRRVAV